MTTLRKITATALSLGLLAGAAPALAMPVPDLPAKPAVATMAGHPDGTIEFARRGRGKDDGPGHQRGGRRGRGADDGPNHG